MTVLDLFGTLLAQTGDVGGDIVGSAATAAPDSVWDFVRKGGVMMIPIGLASLVAMTVIAERLVSLRRRRVIPPSFFPGLNDVLGPRAANRDDAMKYCRDNGSPIAKIVAAGLKRLGGPVEVVERHVQEAGQREVLHLRARLRVLSVTAAVTPLMGLLGTIFGMIRAFQTVATSGDALGKTELLAGGIYEAMITTAGGLVVAIPALLCYHWLSAKVQRLVMDMDQLTVDFIEEHASGPPGAPAISTPSSPPARAAAPVPTRAAPPARLPADAAHAPVPGPGPGPGPGPAPAPERALPPPLPRPSSDLGLAGAAP